MAGAEIDPAEQRAVVDDIPNPVVDLVQADVFATEGLGQEERAPAQEKVPSC